MNARFDQTDFSVVVKNQAPRPKPWRWEIYQAGRNSPIEYSSVYYETMVAANRGRKRGPQAALDRVPCLTTAIATRSRTPVTVRFQVICPRTRVNCDLERAPRPGRDDV